METFVGNEKWACDSTYEISFENSFAVRILVRSDTTHFRQLYALLGTLFLGRNKSFSVLQ